ncbi:hypothetical protein TREMEDRAFT_71444 [Tremella mesenterica DSM 1558]|uniref:uncharacterized protein n=1 Tax=Tremella mesenterica (strain ATCC 24925 / CBS 8224 / DSM 1558 / NBRC 9311 / NRRL Y-6157 / RJB 2259-6 / UBC 559-6) TaxID=578456 RepID=UPI0003F48C35|nr:uncharacterized protein TREMEDRAFT_71444 [Tremella mesenterica DSM 1558]EIW69898.1 hypothetical protein TREMEDRAFT_71444 [Tremella mesenterica DSM 1558]
MSLRSALRVARTARLASPRLTAPKRYASSAHKPSSDLPWAAGSFVIFGGLTALILMPSSNTHHKVAAVHDFPKDPESPVAKAQQTGGHSAVNEMLDQASETDKEEKETPEGGETEAVEKSLKEDAPPVAQAEDESAGPSGDAETPANVDDSDKPSDAEVKGSIKKGMESNAPPVAMDAEAKGKEN